MVSVLGRICSTRKCSAAALCEGLVPLRRRQMSSNVILTSKHHTHFIYGLSWWRCFLLLFFYQQYKAEKSDNVNEYNPWLSCSTCHAERAVFSLRTVFGIPSVSGFQLPDPLPWARHDCGRTGLAEHSAMYITQL